MPKDGLYRAVVFGPTGSGKSQFCNFSQRDLENNINKVSDSLSSCTQDPQSNFINRCGIKIELIDTAGSNDSGNKDAENLQKVCNYLRPKSQIDYIILVLNYEERLQKDTRDYIKILGDMFTTKEFYTHFCVVFTHLPEKENKKVKEKKEKHREEINNIINEIFGIKKNEKLPKVKVYFLNTEVDEDDDGNKKFNEKSQLTVDILIEQMVVDVSRYQPINTTNIETSGKSKHLREDEQEKKIKQLEKILKEKKEREKREEEEKKRLLKEIEENKKNEQELKKRENELKEIERRQEEKKQLLEQVKREAQKREEELNKKEEAIAKKCKDNKIDVQTLNNVIDGAGSFAAGAGIGAGIGTLLMLGGAALTCVCPILGPFVFYTGAGAAVGGGVEAAGAGVVAGVSKIIKTFQ